MSMIRWATLFSSDYQDWPTPDDLFRILDAEFHFTLDACATPTNAKCEHYYTVLDDGLSQDWGAQRVWVNPPYDDTRAWLAKGHKSAQAGALVVCLIAARTDNRAWHDYAMSASEIRFLRGRLRFGNARNTAPFPSAIVIFRPSNAPDEQLSLF
ncbi:MAG TPA: DNA N-6-adenine-methyltransferase [Paludibaculum sp.]